MSHISPRTLTSLAIIALTNRFCGAIVHMVPADPTRQGIPNSR